MPPLETGKKSFIAVNILPSPIGQGDPVEKLQEQIGFAKQLGFTHAWINPISIVPDNTICKRRCLDTGVFSELTGSLYAPNDPKEIRPDFDKVKIRTMGRSAREDNFFILVDFVWKHVSANSTLIKTKPTWFGEKKKLVKDVIEYDFKSLDGHLAPSSEEIIEHLKSSIDVLLDPIEGYGFSGLRIDAASQLIPSVRGALYQHIRARWPKAIIFEEVLFDGAQSTKVNLLVKGAEEHKIYSDFITSNLYYQKSDSFGALPSPETMGDALKLKLADQRGIGFTGNHDHHSLGWGVILTMAAKLLVEKNQFDLADQRVAPFQSYSFMDFSKAHQTITELSNGIKLIENLTTEEQSVIQYLLPFANSIARALLNEKDKDHESYFETYRLQLIEKMLNRTLVGISGYFFLFSELMSPFDTQRIFSNRSGEPLESLFLTEDDLKNEIEITRTILDLMKKSPIYNNFSNFEKQLTLLSSEGKSKTKKIKDKEAQLTYEVRICLPYIIEYLRNNPKANRYSYKDRYQSELSTLNEKLDVVPFIKQINQIYSKLTTIDSSDYHTFTCLDRFKIIVRCSEQSTDVIILNMGYQKIQMITMLDLEKIALWLQARLYPYPVHKGEEVSLALPFTSEGLHYFPGNYKAHWEKIVGAEAFDFSYQRVLGKKQGHQTNLLIGLNISAELSDKDVQQFSQVIQLKTPLQEAYNTLFHRSISQELPQKKETEVPVARDSSKAETMPGFFSATVTKKTNTSPQGIDCVL